MGRATGTEVQPCECGCGVLAKPGRKFLQGHWIRVYPLVQKVEKGRHVEYQAYRRAKQVCSNPRHPKYKDYGGRGIRFLFESFEQWYAELGPRPTPQHSVDRRDNDKGYEPGNMRWATVKEQRANQRQKRLENFTTDQLLAELARRTAA